MSLPRLTLVFGVISIATAERLPVVTGVQMQVSLGDAAYRKLDWQAATRHYESALAEEPDHAAALHGLSRVAMGSGQMERARDLIARAYRSNPKDPSVIRAYAGFVKDRNAERVLLKNYLAAGASGSAGRWEAAARLQVLDRLGDRPVNELRSGYRSYRLATSRFFPTATDAAAGMVLEARINGSKPLRLLFDTGAKGLYMSAKSSRRLDLEMLGPSAATGPDGSTRTGRTALAETVLIGDLALSNALVDIVDMPFADSIDGVAGAALFEQFLIRASGREAYLELEPLNEQPSGTPVVRAGHLLLLQGRVGSAGESGYFVLDTGSAFHVRNQPGAGGSRLTPEALELAGRKHFTRSWIGMDLAGMRRVEGIEVAGIAGYPLLRDNDLIINYRDGWVRLAE